MADLVRTPCDSATCVVVSRTGDRVYVRDVFRWPDGKSVTGDGMVIHVDAWRRFVDAVKSGVFDEVAP